MQDYLKLNTGNNLTRTKSEWFSKLYHKDLREYYLEILNNYQDCKNRGKTLKCKGY